jgi:cysteine desulfurase
MSQIYLDHAASTPLHPQVLEAMVAYWRQKFGNPSSIHAFGRQARQALDDARDRIASRLSCRPSELVFTSGGTESDNAAIFGAAFAQQGRNHIITTEIEHHAVLHACKELESRGIRVTYLPVDRDGRVDPESVRQAIRPDTFLISVMYGNNETGTIQPIQEIGTIARERGILFHVDAVQALGAVPLRLDSLPVDLMSFSAHKINGPQGVGALYISRQAKIHPFLFGGMQERKRRAGTENVAGIIGFAEAVQLAVEHLETRVRSLQAIRLSFIAQLERLLGPENIHLNGHPRECLPHIANISFPGTDTETLLMNLDLEGIAASSGSACTAGSLSISHVLLAMNLPEDLARSAVRFSFGLGNTMEEAEYAAEKIATIVRRLRKK